MKRPFITPDGILRLSASSFAAISECETKARNRLVLGRVPFFTDSGGAIRAGQAIHKVLDGWRRTGIFNEGRTLELLDEEMRPVVDWRTPERAFKLIKGYIETYANDDLRVHEIEGQTASEIRMETELGHIQVNAAQLGREYSDVCKFDRITVQWTSILDLLIRRNKLNYVKDYKTTSMLGPTFDQQFDLNFQQMGYCFAASQLLGEHVAGSIIDALWWNKPGTKGDPTYKYERYIKHYSVEQLNEWRDNVLRMVGDFVGHVIANAYPMRFSQCIGKFGRCEYFDTCTLPVEQRGLYLASALFQDNELHESK